MEKPKEEKPQPAPKSSKLPLILMAAGAICVAIVAGVAVFVFVLRPRLTAEPPKTGEGAHGKAAQAVTVSFDESYATVIMPSPDLPASTLLYKVTLECSGPKTAEKINSNKARFTAKIRELHSYKNRKELDDPLVEQGICRQIQEEANKILKQIPDLPEAKKESTEESRVTAVFHEKFFVQDM